MNAEAEKPRHLCRGAVTERHTKRIKQLSAFGLLQSEIAERLGISVSSVARTQARHGIPHLGRGAQSGDALPKSRG
jgi:DNA-binding NarL/FixJ family response regulator